jgi:hypothetical protein
MFPIFVFAISSRLNFEYLTANNVAVKMIIPPKTIALANSCIHKKYKAINPPTMFNQNFIGWALITISL